MREDVALGTSAREDNHSREGRGVYLRAEGLYLGHTAARSGAVTLACADLNLEVMHHELVCVVGPSGCGKTTFLEALAGLVPVMAGTLLVNGSAIDGPSPDRSLVFQRPTLFPWRTVMKNIVFGLEMQGRLDADARRRAEDILRIVGMSGSADKYPHELSGGMQQRVNLARALATDPTLLLLDEPFSSVDAQTRATLQDELLRIWEAESSDQRKTAVFITHDVDEAVLLADRVLVFTQGPARVALDLAIDLPRPRDPALRRAPEFRQYGEEILTELRSGLNGASDD